MSFSYDLTDMEMITAPGLMLLAPPTEIEVEVMKAMKGMLRNEGENKSRNHPMISLKLESVSILSAENQKAY